MSAPPQIDSRTAARTDARAHGLAQPIAEEAEITWPCSFCGLLRIYEGGRPLGQGHHNDCRECGGRLAINPEDRAAIAKCGARRGSVGALIDKDLF
jgi:hypothetical protein